MKKLVLSLLLVIVAVTAHAGNNCVTKEQCMVFTDLDRFINLDKVMSLSGISSPQSMKLLKQYYDEGSLIAVPASTKVEDITEINQHVSWAVINGVRVLIGNVHIKCD